MRPITPLERVQVVISRRNEASERPVHRRVGRVATLLGTAITLPGQSKAAALRSNIRLPDGSMLLDERGGLWEGTDADIRAKLA